MTKYKVAKVKHKPLTKSEKKKIVGQHPLVDCYLLTGLRLNEMKRVIDNWDGNTDHIDIRTKKSGTYENRIYLLDSVKTHLKGLLRDFKGKNIKKYQLTILKVSNQVGIKFSSHNLRSTFATELIENGVDLISVSTLMNHSDINMTAQYVSLSESTLKSGLETLETKETFEGMNLFQAKKEILRLRKLLKTNEGRYD